MIRAVRLEGSSMLPLFVPGDVVLIRPVVPGSPLSALSPGDCAVYNYEGRKLLHRVLAVSEAGALIGDDAGLIEPHLVNWSDIEGGVSAAHPLKKGLAGLLYSKLRRFAGRSKICRMRA